MCGQLAESGVNLLITADIAIEYQRAIELFGKTFNALLETLAHIGERQLGAFTLAGLGNAVGNRTIGKQARN